MTIHQMILPLADLGIKFERKPPFEGLTVQYTEEHILSIHYEMKASKIVPPQNGLGEKLDRELRAYFKAPQSVDFMDLRRHLAPASTDFQQQVEDAVFNHRRVRAYGAVAHEIGNIARAVAGACGRGRFALVVPFYRIVRKNGRAGFLLGDYHHGNPKVPLEQKKKIGREIKHWLLEREDWEVVNPSNNPSFPLSKWKVRRKSS